HCARVLEDVRQDIDRFLDPSVLKLSGRDGSVGAAAAPLGEAEEALAAGDRTPLELLKLRCAKDSLQSELEDTREETDALMARRERQAGRDMSTITRLTQERDELREDGRTKKRRLSEVEDELRQLQAERSALARSLEDVSERAKRDQEALMREVGDERRRRDAELKGLRQDLAAAELGSRASSLASDGPGSE
ncbi:unnamed protein product, partial [Polarella glacialis]